MFLLYSILFISGFLAGLIDAIAGGGGIITVPILLALGYPPHIALGTNKFQASFGSFTASYYYIKKNVVELKDTATGIIFTLIGASSGVVVVQQVSSELLGKLIPFLMVIIILYSFLKPDLGEKDKQPLISEKFFFLLFGLLLGFYDGFFGPGVGAFWAVALISLLGFNLLKATGYTKIMNFTSNISSLVLFLLWGNVLFTAGVIMAVGQVLGSKVGAKLAITKGVGFIRIVFIFVVIITTLKLIYDKFIA
jgi:hypothetical protein